MGKFKGVSKGSFLTILFLIPFWSVPSIITPMPSIITSVFAENNKSSKNNPGKKSFKERMCSTITDFLEDKITTTKKGSNTSNILQGSLKEVNNLCGKGIVPQVSEIKGLSPKDKEILNKKTENALKKFYDGAGNLPDEDFDGIKLKSSKTGSGTSGTRLSGDTVSDLKSSDPTLLAAKANPVPSLKTTKTQSLSNDSKGQLPPCPEEIPVPCPMSDGVQLYCTKPCYGYYDSLYGALYGEGCLSGGCVYKPKLQPCPEGQIQKPDGTCGCPDNQILVDGKCKPKPGIIDNIKNWIDEKILDKTEECDGNKYNPNKKCCLNGKITDRCGGECYNPETECCQDSKIYEKCATKCYNFKEECCLNNKTLSKNKIKNLSDCLNRFQIPNKPVDVNGCGGKYSHWWISDNPTGSENTSFKDACDAHDICYGDCTKVRYVECDTDFKEDMTTKCEDAHSQASNQCNEMEAGKERDKCEKKAKDLLERCNKFARKYFGGVVKVGQPYYETAQKEHCTCCP